MTDLSKRRPVNLDEETADQLAEWAKEYGGSIAGQIRRLVRQEKERRAKEHNSIREWVDDQPENKE